MFNFFFSIHLSFLLFLWCVGEAAPGEAVGEADDYGANEEEEGRALQLFKVWLTLSQRLSEIEIQALGIGTLTVDLIYTITEKQDFEIVFTIVIVTSV